MSGTSGASGRIPEPVLRLSQDRRAADRARRNVSARQGYPIVFPLEHQISVLVVIERGCSGSGRAWQLTILGCDIWVLRIALRPHANPRLIFLPAAPCRTSGAGRLI